jgi:hypothetical protein
LRPCKARAELPDYVEIIPVAIRQALFADRERTLEEWLRVGKAALPCIEPSHVLKRLCQPRAVLRLRCRRDRERVLEQRLDLGEALHDQQGISRPP